MIAVDASAIVAILQREPGHEALIEALKAAGRAATSPIGVFEATLAIRRILGCSTATAETVVADFLAAANIEVLGLPADAGREALAAFDRYGKGTGHAAKLNMGDCFAYAQARALDAARLYAGDDFTQTDLANPAGRGAPGRPGL